MSVADIRHARPGSHSGYSAVHVLCKVRCANKMVTRRLDLSNLDTSFGYIHYSTTTVGRRFPTLVGEKGTERHPHT